MTEPVRIVTLAERPDLVAMLAALHQPQWSASHPTWSMADWEREFSQHQGKGLPLTLLALDAEGRLQGSASLVADDMNGATAFSPWLANVLVLPPARGNGTGSRLIRAIEAAAQQQGHGCLHLFTEDQQALYERRGWTVLESRVFEGKAVTLMRKMLG